MNANIFTFFKSTSANKCTNKQLPVKKTEKEKEGVGEEKILKLIQQKGHAIFKEKNGLCFKYTDYRYRRRNKFTC